jgi:hypothetical protein
MNRIQVGVGAVAGALLLTAGAGEARASLITVTAVVSDRGIDGFPRDGVFDGVFGNPSVTQVTTPPSGDPGSEERTAIEFLLTALFPADTIVDSVSLTLSPQGSALNLGLGPGEVAEVHGYSGDGTIQVADLMVANSVGSIGPTADGPVTIALATSWFQALVDAADSHAGLMFKGVDGPNAVLFNFAGTFSGIPIANRPTLSVEYHTPENPTPVPEPATLGLVAVGAVLAAQRGRMRRRRPASPPRS